LHCCQCPLKFTVPATLGICSVTVAVLVESSDGDTETAARKRCSRRGEREVRCCFRADRDGVGCPGDRSGDSIGCRDRLGPGGDQGCAKRSRAGSKGCIGRQGCARIAANEVHGAGITGSVFPPASSAVTVKVNPVPAVVVAGAETLNRAAGPVFTVISPEVPVIDEWTVSVAVIVRIPWVFSVVPNDPVPDVRCEFKGRSAAASVEEKVTVPLYAVAMFS